MGISAETTEVEKSAIGKCADAFIEVIADRYVIEYLHLPSVAVEGAEIHEGLWRSGVGIRFERERGTKGAMMARSTALVTSSCLCEHD